MDEEKKGPYHGTILISILLIIVPILFTLIFGYFINLWEKFPREINNISAVILGFGIGCLFDLSYFVLGIFNKHISNIIKRIKEFLSDAKISIKLAFKGYWLNILEDGVAFWIYFIIITITFKIEIKSIIQCLKMLKFLNLL